MEPKSAPSSYRDYHSEAKTLVQRLLRDALEEMREEEQRLVAWPLGKDFEPELGLKCIEDLVQARLHANKPVFYRVHDTFKRIISCYIIFQ